MCWGMEGGGKGLKHNTTFGIITGGGFPNHGGPTIQFRSHLKGFALMNMQTFSFFEYIRAPLVVQPLFDGLNRVAE